MTTLNLLKKYLSLFFVEKTPEKILSLLTDDIYCCGLAAGIEIENMEQAKILLHSIKYDEFMTCRITFLRERQISDDSAMILYTLSYQEVTLQYRLMGHSRCTQNGRKLYLLNFCLENQEQRPVLFEDRAIISACSDITEAKDHERFLDGLVDSLNGDLAMLAVDAVHKRTIPVYVSDGMGGKQGLNKEEYLKKYSRDGMESIYEGDRERVWHAIVDSIQNEKAPSISFRILNRQNKPRWINASFSRYGENNGMPVILVLFTACTVQNELQMHILNQDSIGIALIDADSNEIYYVNDSMFCLLELPVDEYTGKRCPEVLHGCGTSCDQCQLHNAKSESALDKTVYLNHKWFHAHTERRYWNDRRVICVYLRDMTQQHQLYQKLEESNKELMLQEEMLRGACDFTHIWTWAYDIPNNRIFPSFQLQRDFGMPKVLNNFPESWLAMGFIQPEYIELHRQKVQAIRDGSDREEFEVRIMHRDGSLHWSRILFHRMETDANRAICTAQLIDSEKVLQARLDLENSKTISSDQLMLDYAITNVTKNRVLAHNTAQLVTPVAQLGMTMEQATERAKSFLHKKDRDSYSRLHDRNKILEAYKNGETSFEFVGHRADKDGIFRWVKSTMNLRQNPTNGEILLYEYVYDIHDQKMAQEIMAATARFDYERVASVNILEDQMDVLNPDNSGDSNELNIWNYTKHLQGYSEEMVLPEEREKFLEALSLKTLAQKLAQKDKYEYTVRVLEADGSVGYRRSRFSIYHREMGICLMTRTDVTNVMRQEEERTRQIAEALKQAREALERAESAAKAKSEFLSRMSHEIRTPMNAIMGMTAIAKENCFDFHQVGECLDKIEMSSHFLLTLINDILEMSRIESDRMKIKQKEFDFAYLIECVYTVVQPLALNSNLRFDFINNVKTGGGYVGDPVRVQQVLVNVITNAIKFTAPGGRVRFRVDIESEALSQTKFRFSVSDTGIGMSEDFMERMFQPFTQEDGSNTSAFDGSGLGLAISKSLVEAMGGSIWAESYLGVGSTFTIQIPLKRVCSQTHSNPPGKDTAGQTEDFEMLHGCQILMAEDHPLNVMVAKRILERKGVIVTVAENGQIAVDLFRNSKYGYFDAILMDIRMPVLDGFDAALAIRSLDRPDAAKIPIIAITANALEADRQRARDVGMNEHLAKPFEPVQLYRVLAAQIKKSQLNQSKEKHAFETKIHF